MKIRTLILTTFFVPLVWGVSSDDIPVEPIKLYGLISQSDRMSITVNTIDGESEIFTSSSPDDIRSFSDSLELIQPTKGEWFHCMCGGSPAIYFFKGTNETIRLTNHHGKSIRCSLWYSDVAIKDVDKWVSWFDEHGMNFVGNEVEEARKVEENQRKKKWEQWHTATPESLQPSLHSPNQSIDNIDISSLVETHGNAIADRHLQILTLLEWYGSGTGHWIEYPAYEKAAEQILLCYSTKDVVGAILSTDLSTAQLEGSARLYCSNEYKNNRTEELKELPSSLREQLWKYVLRSKNHGHKRPLACDLVGIPSSLPEGSKMIEGDWVYEGVGSILHFSGDGTFTIKELNDASVFSSKVKWKYISIGRLSLSDSKRCSSNYNVLSLTPDSMELLMGSRTRYKFKRK